MACADRAYTQARRHLGNAADADDAVQEACLQLAHDGRRFDGGVPFAVWVVRRVQIACLRLRRSDLRRRRREREAMAMPRPAPGPDDLAEAVRALVVRLPMADQVVIDLHYFAGLPQAEVAAALGSSENAVALRLSRARAQLRTLLGGSATTASVALLLTAQPAHAAPPSVLAGIHDMLADKSAHRRQKIVKGWDRLIGRPGVPMQPHIAVYVPVEPRHTEPSLRVRVGVFMAAVVVRHATGWRLVQVPDDTVEEFADLAALQRRLAGLALVAGTAAERLQPLTLAEAPSFDRRWLPPPAVIADHLPRYRLRLAGTPTGLRAVEDGAPLVGPLAVIAAATTQRGTLQSLHEQALVRREGPALEARHRVAIAALRRAYTALAPRPPDAEPLLTPSQMLAAAGVPLADRRHTADRHPGRRPRLLPPFGLAPPEL